MLVVVEVILDTKVIGTSRQKAHAELTVRTHFNRFLVITMLTIVVVLVPKPTTTFVSPQNQTHINSILKAVTLATLTPPRVEVLVVAEITGQPDGRVTVVLVVPETR